MILAGELMRILSRLFENLLWRVSICYEMEEFGDEWNNSQNRER